MEVLFILAGLSILAIFAGWCWNQSDMDSHEVGLWSFIADVALTAAYLTWLDTLPILGKAGFAALVLICFVVSLRKSPDQSAAAANPNTVSKQAVADFPHNHDTFFESGYEDRQGNRVPLGS